MGEGLKTDKKYVIMEEEKAKEKLYEDMVKRAHQRQLLADIINWEERFKANRVPEFVQRKLIKPYEKRVINTAKQRLLTNKVDWPLTEKQTRILKETLSEIGRRLSTQYHSGKLIKDHHYFKEQFDIFKGSVRKRLNNFEDIILIDQIVYSEAITDGWGP